MSTYIIGDVHGCYDQFVCLLNKIDYNSQKDKIVITGDLVNSSIEDEANQVIQNIISICEAAGHSLDDVVKITIFLTDLGNFATVNEVMTKHFSDPYPARATIEVSGLPLGVNVEIEAIVGTNG